MNSETDNFPDEVLAVLAEHGEGEGTPSELDALSQVIAGRRDEAKNARAASGIEQVWKECEESYVGIDDANRAEFQNAKWSKPMAMSGPVTTDQRPKTPDNKSTVFVRITARYVDAGAAKLGEILLPADDKAFSFTETPVPDLITAKDDKSQVLHDGMGNIPLTRPAKPGEVPPQQPQDLRTGLPNGPEAPQVPLTVKDLAEEAIEIARKKAQKAEKRIADWMVECQRTAEVRKVIFDGARIGVGVLKGPFPEPKQSLAVKRDGTKRLQLVVEDKINPASRWRSPWNFFPDPACGEDIHNGDFCFERDYVSSQELRRLKKLPGYIASQIDKVLEEGAGGQTDGEDSSQSTQTLTERKGQFEIWYYYGVLTKGEMACVRAAGGQPLRDDDISPDKDQCFAIVTMVNSTIIRATFNPLESGKFPYHTFPWQRRAGHWAGIGVAEQVRVPQRMVNAATRAMLNNAGKSAGSQVVVDLSCIKPADGNWLINPDKIWYKTGDSPTGGGVDQTFAIHEIPNHTPELMSIINYGMRLAEESTSIPLITQGQSGPTTPDTFGAAQLQNNNANQLLRSIGYSFDDYITEPEVRGYYEWLLLDPDVPDDEKGDFTINAHGSVALVERAIQDQTIAQMGPMVKDPAYGLDPKKWAPMFLRTKRIVPADLQYTPEEQERLDKQPPPESPAVQAAKVRAASAEKIAQGTQAIDAKEIEQDHEAVRASLTVDLHELELRKELAMLEYANRERISVSQVKAQLAQTAMKLNTERQLNAQNNGEDATAGTPPPVQAPGRAADGHAFDQKAAAE